MDDPRDYARVVRRAVGIAALALFLAGLLVSADLEELVVVTGGLAALCAAAGLGTWMLARHRRALLRRAVGAYRATAPVLGRAGRATERALVAASAAAARAARGVLHRSGPALRRADVELALAVRPLAASSRRGASRLVARLVADIHTYRADIDAYRSARSTPRRPRTPARAEARPVRERRKR